MSFISAPPRLWFKKNMKQLVHLQFITSHLDTMFTLSTLMQSAPSVLGTEWGACCTQYWCPCSQWGSAMYMMCPELVSRKEEGRELEMEGWSERWVIFSLRHCCFPPSPVIFTQKWMPGSGWKKGSFFLFQHLVKFYDWGRRWLNLKHLNEHIPV